MNPQFLGILAAIAAVLFVFEMLRRGVLPERFAALWISVSGMLLVLAVIPGLLEWAANLIGIQVPANLLFFGAGVLLLLVSVQLSYEVGRLESRTRRLAEELALLRDRIRDAEQEFRQIDQMGPSAASDPSVGPDEAGMR